MKTIEKLKTQKQKLLRFLFGSFSATAIMFTFQACYGMPPSLSVQIHGTVVNASTEEPVQGLMVTIPRTGLTDTTDQNGNFSFPDPMFVDNNDMLDVQVSDIDGTDNDSYAQLDTLINAEDLNTSLVLKVQKVNEKN